MAIEHPHLQYGLHLRQVHFPVSNVSLLEGALGFATDADGNKLTKYIRTQMVDFMVIFIPWYPNP